MSNTRNGAVCECPPHKKESVLTFDGGGIRGLASLFILRELLVLIRGYEQKRDGLTTANREPSTVDQTKLPLASYYFSFMFGTSTGGIIAIMLGRLRMDIKECIHVYREFGTRIFAKKQPLSFLGQNKYDYKKLEKFVKDTARAQSLVRNEDDDSDGPWMHDPGVVNAKEKEEAERAGNRFVPCRVGVLAVETCDAEQKIHMFRSYYNPTPPNRDQDRPLLRLNLEEQSGARICKVAHATSAAPYYFRSVKVRGLKYLDGGLIANNPAKYAWGEATSMHLNHPSGSCPTAGSKGGIRFLVSIGTGKRAEEQIKSGTIRKALSIFNRGVQKMTDPEDAHEWIERTIAHEGNPHDLYYRFNVETGLEHMNLDDCRVGKNGSNTTYLEIEAAVTKYLLNGSVRLRMKSLAKQLVDNRRRKFKRGNQGLQGLCTPGPLVHGHDDRYSNEEDPTSPNGTIETRINGSYEMQAGPPEVPELQPRSPAQDPIRSPTQHMAPNHPHDTPLSGQGQWTSLPRLNTQGITGADHITVTDLDSTNSV